MGIELLLLVLLGGMLVFMFINSRKRTAKMREQEELRQQKMLPGARVMTRSGMYGTLVAFDASDLTQPALIDIAPGVTIEVHAQAIDLAPETEEPVPADDVIDAEIEEEPETHSDEPIIIDEAPSARPVDAPDDKPKA